MKFGRTLLGVSCIGAIIVGCSDNSTEPPPTPPAPVVRGTVIDVSDSAVIEAANVTLYNANTNEPVGRSFTDGNGRYLLQAPTEGTYYLKIEAQGYYPIPGAGGSAIPFQAPVSDTVWEDASLSPNPDAGTLGGFGGHVETSTDQAVSSVLVVAVSGNATYSGTSGPDGYYVFYNIPPGTYEIQTHAAGYLQSSTGVTADVTAGVFTATHADIAVTAGTYGTVDGHVSFVAVSNPDSGIDITLIHPTAREAVPGLATLISQSSGSYTIVSVPYDTYVVWASYRNDGYVMDPDAIHKFGLPVVTMSQANPDTTIDFKVTGAVQLVSPTNPPDSVYPVPVNTTTPTLTWTKTSSYSSAKEFIIEVFDRNGRVIWGGFDTAGVVRHPQIASTDPQTVVYNFDGSATDTLTDGEIYRWKVYADNDDALNVQTLLSSSEYLMGLFKVVIDTTGS